MGRSLFEPAAGFAAGRIAVTGFDLAAQCRAAQDAGMDFAAVWHEILKESPLVVGPPLQMVRDGCARLAVPLASGGFMTFDVFSSVMAA